MRQFHRAFVAVLTLALHALARGQQPDAASPSQPAPTDAGKSARTADDALLARAATLYYSTRSAGLTGFDCTVHPDWLKLMQSWESQSTVTEGNLLLLKSVAISLHARMNGGSTLQWIQPTNSSKPLDQASADTIDQVHKTIEKTLMDFMQFWTPMVDGSMIPLSSAGIEMRHSPSGIILLMKQPDAIVMEVFSNELVLKEFRIITGGKMMDVLPTYDSADEGFLVSNFVAHTGTASIPSTQLQETDAGIDYQTVEGIPIPLRLNVAVPETGTFSFKLDGCRVNPKP